MTSSSANDPATLPGANMIVDLFPRRRAHDTINELLFSLQRDRRVTLPVRRMIATAVAVFGDEFVFELRRAIERDGHRLAAAVVVVLRVIATEPARALLWQVGRERRYGPPAQLDALRALCHLGERVDIQELVALANLCETLSAYHGTEFH